jgi:hypothetical protein
VPSALTVLIKITGVPKYRIDGSPITWKDCTFLLLKECNDEKMEESGADGAPVLILKSLFVPNPRPPDSDGSREGRLTEG